MGLFSIVPNVCHPFQLVRSCHRSKKASRDEKPVDNEDISSLRVYFGPSGAPRTTPTPLVLFSCILDSSIPDCLRKLTRLEIGFRLNGDIMF